MMVSTMSGCAFGEVARGEIELVVVDQAVAVGELARAGRCLGRGQERIPDHPGIDRALLERSARIGRRQERGLHVGIGDARLLQRLDQKVMDVRALVQRDVLALQVGDAS